MPVVNKTAATAIEEAARLVRAVKEANARIDELKVIIRAEASKIATKRGDDEKVEFESDEGVATICFPNDKVTLVKGARPIDLKDTLPEKVWDTLFEEVVELSDDFKDAFPNLPVTQKKLVAPLVEFKPSEPRVTLPK